MYDAVGKLLNGIKSIYVDSQACVIIKREDIVSGSGWLMGKIYRCIVSPWLLNLYMDAVMKEVKIGMGRKGES